MSAKEMFEKLGYEFKKEKGIGIVYYKFVSNEDKENLCGYDWENKVTFFEKQVYSDKYINMDLLQAINKQIEELGWNKDD